MRRFRRRTARVERADPSEARDLLDLAARMGIPPEDATRQVSQLINDARHADADATRASVAPGT